MKNDIRTLIELRLNSSRINVATLFNGESFNRELIKQIFPMLSFELMHEADRTIHSMLEDAGADACRKICYSDAYEEFISDDSNAERYEQIDDALQGSAMSREQCYIVLKEMLPNELELHEKINPRGERFLRNIIISYVSHALLHLLIQNDDSIIITWGPSCADEDVRATHGLLYGKNMLLKDAVSKGFNVAYGCKCCSLECKTNQANHRLLNQLRKPYKKSLLQKINQFFF
ncbi:hypothetical protein HUO09_05670 [Vibrio sp. Y2-5]|uniref:hypothetical protein n=1 Tax=Vibrio sp. Y2-5 TaxID=2743977 RepID=UPI0016611C1E|nr:hypothetical protein [Vibrio sp. Y2-5]MBD0785820.1 hypothetical protein [Vibrio sp. Y2-5]